MRFRDFVGVAKPWLVAANLVTAGAGFFLGCGGAVAWGTFFAALAGIGLVVASGCVANNCIDSRLDRAMARTRARAMAAGRMPLWLGLAYAVVLGLLGTAVLAVWTTPAMVAVTLGGFVVYVGVYSAWLKRRSPLSTVVGSLAGAAPPLAAYCAAGGSLDLGAALVLALFCLWQVPHSYAVTLHRFDDYAAAGLPVLPVRQGFDATRRHIVWHIAAFTLAAALLGVLGYAGQAYLAVAVVSGACWLAVALHGYSAALARGWGRRVYLASIVVVCLLALALALDPAKRGDAGDSPTDAPTAQS